MGSPKEGPLSHSAPLQDAAEATGQKGQAGFQRRTFGVYLAHF